MHSQLKKKATLTWATFVFFPLEISKVRKLLITWTNGTTPPGEHSVTSLHKNDSSALKAHQNTTQLNMHLPWGDYKDTPTPWKNKQSHTKVIQSERQAEQPEPGTGTQSFCIQKKWPMQWDGNGVKQTQQNAQVRIFKGFSLKPGAGETF